MKEVVQGSGSNDKYGYGRDIYGYGSQVRYNGKVIKNEKMIGDEKHVIIYNTMVKKLYNKTYEEMKLDDSNSVLHYLDSACTAHLTSSECLLDIKSVKNVMVVGITGEQAATGWGHLGILGRAFVAPSTNVRLISIPQLDLAGCTGSYGKGIMYVYDCNKKMILKGIRDHTGLYGVRLPKMSKVKQSEKNNTSGVIHELKIKVNVMNQHIARKDLDHHDDINDIKRQSSIQEDDFDYRNAPINEIADRIMKFDKVFINAEMRKRAIGARSCHCKLSHPCDKVLGQALDNSVYEDTIYTATDLRNAEILLGKCLGCIEAKMTAPPEDTVNISKSTDISSTLYMDVVRVTGMTTGGNREIVFATEETSDYLSMSGCKTKGYTDVLEAVMRIIHEHNQYGHKVKNVIFDNEMIFVSIGDELRKIGIEPLYTPAQRHNKLMERKMREIKDKCRAIRASQRYKLSDHLRGELLSRAISSINATPNGKTGPTKTIIPAFEFGQIGITNARRGDEPEQRAEYGIFLDNMYNSKSHFKVYVPSRKQVYSKRTFVPTTQYPTGWNLVPRMRDLNEMEEFIGKDDDIRSTSKIDLMNSNDP